MIEQWNIKSIFIILLIGYSSVMLALGFDSILIGLIAFIIGFLFWVLFVNWFYVAWKGREFRKFIYQVGMEKEPPNTENYANGWFIYKKYRDIATVSLTNEGLHVYRMGLCSVHIGWDDFERLIIHKGTPTLMATVEILANGLRNKDFAIPWEEGLTKMIPSSEIAV